MARVLILDDQPIILRMLRRALVAQHDVFATTSAVAALDALRDESFDAVFVDLRMPGLNGNEFIQHALILDPSMKGRFVMMSADRDGARGDVPVLAKPFPDETLVAAVEQCCDGNVRLSQAPRAA